MIAINPIDFISVLNESDSYIEKIYLNGGCYQFFKVLKTLFPYAEPYINESKDHVVTLINGVFYDITGVVYGAFQPLSLEDKSLCEKWSFSRNNWIYRECVNCGEYIES